MSYFSRELIVLLVSALPIGELRIGIPLGAYLGLPLEVSAFWAVIGSILPMFFILAFLDPVSKFLMKHSKFINKLLTGIFERTRKKHTKTMETVGSVFLVILVALPVPLIGGAWTGALVCYLFNVPYWKSILIIFLGLLGAAAIMSLGVIGANEIPGFVRYLLNK
jgi:uncharacterized membrane protein